MDDFVLTDIAEMQFNIIALKKLDRKFTDHNILVLEPTVNEEALTLDLKPDERLSHLEKVWLTKCFMESVPIHMDMAEKVHAQVRNRLRIQSYELQGYVYNLTKEA